MSRNRRFDFCAFRLFALLSLFLLFSGCSTSSSTSNSIGFSCESDPQPPRIGINTFTVILTSTNGERLTGAQIQIEGDMSHPGMGPVFGKVEEVVPGSYRGTLDLNMRGDWIVLFHIKLANGVTFDRELKLKNIQAT